MTQLYDLHSSSINVQWITIMNSLFASLCVCLFVCTLVCLKIRYQFVCYVGFAIVPQPSVNTAQVMHEVRLQCEAIELPEVRSTCLLTLYSLFSAVLSEVFCVGEQERVR